MAAHKLLLGSFWSLGLVISQLIISALSGVYLFKLAALLFPDDRRVALWAAAVFAVFPLTLWWVHTFCTEMLFQSLFIISVYYFVLSFKMKQLKFAALSAAIFSVVFLTKSHILLFTPFIAAAYLIAVGPASRGMLYALCFAAITTAATLPFGIYNLYRNGQYVLASNGLRFHFYTGNSEFGYASIVRVPPPNTSDFIMLRNMNIAHFNGAVHDSIMELPQKVKQRLYLEQSLQWIKNNPEKFAVMKAYNLFRFLIPGVSIKQYPLVQWLLSFLISLPVYVLGYAGIGKALKENFKTHFFMLGIFLALLFFSVVFYSQNRFRTITLEPFYILYAAYGITFLHDFFRRKQLSAGLSVPGQQPHVYQ